MTPEQQRPVCGFIGLGSQGAPLAQRMIDAGYRVLLWARRPETLDPFRGGQGVIVDTLAELGAQADHVALCVLDDGPVLEVTDRLIPTMRAGSRIVVHSTTLPETCRILAERARARDIALIDAPVSGGAPAAHIGAMTVMIGGDRDVVAAARPVFESFAQLIVHLGDVGAGQVAKLINNSLLVANMALAHSAVSLGVDNGLDRRALGELLKASSGRSYGLDVYLRQANIGAFSNLEPLLDKVRLLGRIAGAEDACFAVLREAAFSLRAPVA